MSDVSTDNKIVGLRLRVPVVCSPRGFAFLQPDSSPDLQSVMGM